VLPAAELDDELAPNKTAGSDPAVLKRNAFDHGIFVMAIQTRNEGLCCSRRVLPRLREKYPIRSLALFGSCAHRTDFDSESDVDILVDVDPSIGWHFVALAEELEQVLDRRVDLVSSRALKPRLRKQVEGDLIPIRA
jgi:predicted nucleotidyltransferase